MDYHQNARLTAHSREQMAKWVVEQNLTLQAAAAACNVTAKTAAKWTRRYRQGGWAGLRDLRSKPHRSPRQTSSTLLEKVLQLRRQRRNGWRIACQLRLSRATVSRILQRAGLSRLRSLDPPPPRCPLRTPASRRPGSFRHQAPGAYPQTWTSRYRRSPQRVPRRGRGVSPRGYRRPQPHRLLRHPARSESSLSDALLPHGQGSLCPLRLLHPPRAD